MFRNVKTESSSRLTFDVDDVDVSLVNALRRVILAEVPTVAFSFDPTVSENDIDIITNTGSLHNEFLGHRLSLVPICLNKQEIDEFHTDKYTFVIKIQNVSNVMLPVTSKDIKVYKQNDEEVGQDVRDKMFPANPITHHHILITKLKPNLFDSRKGDKIHLVAKASLGKGKQHSRWCPASLCTFYNNIDEKEREDAYDMYENKHAQLGLPADELRKRFDTLEAYRCFSKNKYGEPNSLHFDLQSECGMAPSEIIENALHVLLDKLTTFVKNTDIKENIDVKLIQGTWHVTIPGEDHTLANLLQSFIYNKFIRKDGTISDYVIADLGIVYVGYFKPHPLEDCVLLKIRLTGDVHDALKAGANEVVKCLRTMIDEWVKLSKL